MSSYFNRILALDVIRGIALFGILIVNMMSFHSPILYVNPENWWFSRGERAVYIIIDLFFQASFYPLFSLLFGYSLVIFRQRAFERNRPFNLLAVRRFCFLFMIGALHALFVWYGDILMVYALLGILSIPFLKMTPKLLLMFGSILYLLANTLFVLFLGVTDFLHIDSGEYTGNNKLVNSVIHIYQTGTFGEITLRRVHDWMIEYNPQTVILLLFTVFPLFLIGAGLSKYRLLEKVAENRNPWMRFTVSAFFLGVLGKTLPYFVGGFKSIEYLQDAFGGSLLAAAYCGVIVIFLQRKKWEKPLSFFSWVGKMSITNYLFQSSAAALLFYGYGFQLFGRISLVNGTFMALGIFMVQFLLSIFWLKLFVYGPIEWLWRCFTYWVIIPWKKRKKPVNNLLLQRKENEY